MKKLPLILFILLAACAPVPQVTVTPSAISTEQPFVGYGGELTEDQQAFIESEEGIRLAQAYDDYANYLMQARIDGGDTYWAKGTKISLIPMMDRKYPGDISKGFFVGEVTTDPKMKGSFFTMPMSQVKKYLETRDVNVLAPPPSTGKLFGYSEPVFLTRQVTDGSVPAEAGIEIGSILQFFDQNFVYQAGTIENLEITGHMDENFQWVADARTYTAEQLAKMNASDLLKNAPVIEDHEKTASRAGKHVVLYKNAEGVIDQAYNYLTGEMTAVIEISFDPNKPTKISMDDLTTGKLAASEHLQCHGFPDTAIPIDWEQVTAEGYFTNVQQWNQRQDYSDPATRPQKFCSFSELTIDLGRGEMPYIVIGVANLNTDRTIGFLHKPTRPEDVDKYLEIEDSKFFGIITDQIRNDAEYPEKEAMLKLTPDIKEWGQEWADNDILPEELEKCLVQLS